MSRYRLVGRLETGELAELYKAVRDDGATVTIKLFHEKTSDAAYARELANTARILNPLAHEGLIHYLELGTVKKRLAVVREHAEGFSLGQALQRLATKEVLLPPAVALHIMIELLEAVQRGHEAGCIHGAITPGNIALTAEGRSQVSDFGALRALEASPALKAFVNKGRGTYRAPEVSKGEEVTPEADVYSLGAIAYELLTLRELNPGKGMSVRREAVQPPSRLDRRINSRLDPIIMRAVELMPGRRYRQCSEMVTALRNFLSASGGMPSKEDVKKFVRELFPNEVKGDSLGPVPFEEEFELKGVSGAEDLPEVQEDRSGAVEPRPAFSGEFEPNLPPSEEEHSEVSGSRRETLAEAKVASSGNRPKVEPNFDDGTAPGHAGPLEQGWDAPAAASAPKGPKLRPQGVVNTSGATSALKGRVRVVEDFAPLPTMSQEIRDEDVREAATRKPKAPASAPTKVEKASYAADPGPTSAPGASVTSSGPQKLTTVEKRVKARSELQRKMIYAAGAIAVVGAAAFGYAVWKFKDKPTRRTADPDQAVSLPDPNAFTKKPAKKDPVVVKKDDPPPKTDRDDPPTKADLAPAKKDIGYVSIASNMSAWVYIDGTKLKTKTPIKRHPVASGSRTIMLESVLTGERKKFKLDVAPRKEVKIAETFAKRPRR